MATTSAPWSSRAARWRENPEQMAWVVLLASFSVFALLAITLPLLAIYTVNQATVAQTARIEPTQGTLLLYENSRSEPIAITSARENIAEGARLVAADEATQATLSLNSDPATGETLGSVQLYSGSDMTLERLRRPIFNRSREPFSTRMTLENGQARIFTSPSDHRAIAVELLTPHGAMILQPGTYQVSVSAEDTEITVRAGEAAVTADAARSSEPLLIVAGQRAWMNADEVSGQVTTLEQNLVRNGSFTPPVLDDWPSYQVAEASTTPGKVQFSEGEDGRLVAQFIRMGEEKLHTEVGITQQVAQAVNVYDDLRIQLDVQVLFQSLPGAGSLNSEFPLRVEIAYTDIYGKDLTWGHGFYYREPEEGEPYPPVTNGTRVRQGQWFTYLSPDLIELLDTQGTRPATINSIRLYASGHNYQSMASEVYLLAE
ncbi:MAG: hypothetical protein ACRC1H_06650 [Caldilineaceae bacterium]